MSDAGSVTSSTATSSTGLCFKQFEQLPLEELRAVDESTLSKNARKRYKKTLQYLEGKEKQRQAKAARDKRAAAAAATGTSKPSRSAIRRQQETADFIARSAGAPTVCIDMSYGEYMREVEIRSLLQQVAYSYAANRRHAKPLRFAMSSVDAQWKSRLEEQHSGYGAWTVDVLEQSYNESYSKDSIVYLTSEATDVVETLHPDKVYIIGGIIDRNSHKGLSFERATAKGIATARLPIDEYMRMTACRVLATNHVFEILLQFHDTQDWQEAFLKVIPQRKNRQLVAREREDGTIVYEQMGRRRRKLAARAAQRADGGGGGSSAGDREDGTEDSMDAGSSMHEASDAGAAEMAPKERPKRKLQAAAADETGGVDGGVEAKRSSHGTGEPAPPESM